ncbi:MAG: hypothetical protein RLZZ123_786 [Pseudomonadota bacterium]
MPMRHKHPLKEVEEALRYAETHGWMVIKGGHWGLLYCPFNDPACRCGTRCKAGIWGTPKSASNHARQLRSVVDGCVALRQRRSAAR